MHPSIPCLSQTPARIVRKYPPHHLLHPNQTPPPPILTHVSPLRCNVPHTATNGTTQEAFRAQEVEQGRGDPLAKDIDIWGNSSATATTAGAAAAAAVAPAEGSAGTGAGATKEALTQRGFMILVKLIEELQFEKELEQDKGVGLAPGRVCVV